MFVEYQRRGEGVELLACSENKETLRNKMRDDIREFTESVYGEGWEEEADWLVKPDDVEYYWSDEDEEYETIFQIVEVSEI